MYLEQRNYPHFARTHSCQIPQAVGGSLLKYLRRNPRSLLWGGSWMLWYWYLPAAISHCVRVCVCVSPVPMTRAGWGWVLVSLSCCLRGLPAGSAWVGQATALPLCLSAHSYYIQGIGGDCSHPACPRCALCGVISAVTF